MLAIARSASSVRLALLGALTSLAIQACGGGDANPSGAGSGTTSDGATPNVADAASRDGAASGNGMTGSDSTTNSDNPIDDATSNDGTSTTGSDGTTNHDGTTATPD
ncbi:MAG TPA: hypothetical protein VGY54_05590, partial [Polyangiaceae bacterium]|nr:hypothetical protein [Polyangiaceae bacterium]